MVLTITTALLRYADDKSPSPALPTLKAWVNAHRAELALAILVLSGVVAT